ncbi:hypothetical protein GCM10027063_39410 [Promicromonospora xylanilytica]
MSVTKFGTAAVVAAAAALPAAAGWAFASAAVAVVLIAVAGFLIALQRFTRASGAVRKDLIALVDRIVTAARGEDEARCRRGGDGCSSGRGNGPDTRGEDR